MQCAHSTLDTSAVEKQHMFTYDQALSFTLLLFFNIFFLLVFICAYKAWVKALSFILPQKYFRVDRDKDKPRFPELVNELNKIQKRRYTE
jgi:hypothetical protein